MRSILLAALFLASPAIVHAEDMMGEIKTFQFAPKEMTVKAGAVIKWTNMDAVDHSVTDQGGAFDTGFFNKGETREITAPAPGTYDIFCARHPSMKGKIIVTE